MKLLFISAFILSGSTAFARGICRGSNGIDTLPECTLQTEGRICALETSETYQRYQCIQGNWTAVPRINTSSQQTDVIVEEWAE